MTSETASRLASALADRYRIERELGQGGMATVYLARDLKHERDVAIKVLRPELAAVIGAERFLAEIKTTANLQHPHILPLFDSGVVEGTVFYAMPFVEGESLRDRLAHDKQLPVIDAVRIATEVASALDYAHRKGVIHRDIKPENILLHDGQALVADFGIALAATTTGGTRMTETGMSLGTPHYMSPEQAMGEREISARADIYALGCVLYEMLTGEPPFTGPTAQAIVARVMTESPRGLTGQRHTVPPHVEAAVLTALEKLPADRFASAAEFSVAMNTPGSGVVTHAVAPATVAARRPAVALLALAGAALIGAGAALGVYISRPASASDPVIRVTMSLPDSLGLRGVGTLRIAISPDGRRVAWVGGFGGIPGIIVRDFSDPNPRFLAGTEGAQAPFFSPDGEMIGFFAGRSTTGSIKSVPAAGGTVQTILAGNVEPWGGDWTDDNEIYFTGANSRLAKVSASGGAVTIVSAIDSVISGVSEHDFIDVLPNGKGAIVQLWRGGPGRNLIGILDLRAGTMDTLGLGGFARYIRTGHVLYATADGRVHIIPFDMERLRATGQPSVVLEGVPMDNTSGSAQFAVSDNGTLVYQSALGIGRSYATWVTRSGQFSVVDSSWTVSAAEGVELSPDGRRVATTHTTAEGTQIWIKTLPQGPFTRLTYSEGTSDRPVWSPDGERIAFLSEEGPGGRQVWVKRADGSNNATLLATYPGKMDEAEFSRDGRWLVGRTFGAGGGTRKLLVMRLGVDTVMRILLDGPSDMYSPTVSPDSRWIAYASEESGQPEVFVRPFPDVSAARWQVSVGGGREPRWSRDGRELYYRTERGELMAVKVTTSPAFAFESPVILFTDMAAMAGVFHRNYDVGADGRFLTVRSAAEASGSLNVVFNWFTEIEQRFGGQ